MDELYSVVVVYAEGRCIVCGVIDALHCGMCLECFEQYYAGGE